MNRILLLIYLSFFASSLFSQVSDYSKKNIIQNFSTYKNFDQKISHKNFFKKKGLEMGLSNDDEMRLSNQSIGKNNYVHNHFHQYYKGIKVYGQKYIVHDKNNITITANGTFLPQLELVTTPSTELSSAVRQAKMLMNSKNCHLDKTEIVIVDQKFPQFSGEYSLCYKIDLHEHSNHKAFSFFIDAHTGELINKISLHEHNGVPGTGVTKYYGEQNITVDSIAPDQYVLHDPTRGRDGIIIEGADSTEFISTSTHFNLTNETQDEVAVDALYLTAGYYDLLRDDYNWLGLDDENGSFIVTIINDGSDLVNAFWNQERATFGAGNCNYGPLVTADVLAHEFMHGIIDYTSQLIYSGESGAINESMADVMGKAYEYHIDRDNFSWGLGNKFALYQELTPFRIMDDPEQVEDPSYYKGSLWVDGAGVHTNSAVGNLYFVRLSDGATGTNYDNQDYSVSALGVIEASKFIFFTNRHYLNPSSDYNDYYNASLLAAEEYFDGDTDMIFNISEAWKSVGLPYEVDDGTGTGDSTMVSHDLSIISESFVEVCGYDNAVDFEFTITNEGKEDYNPTVESARVGLSIDGNLESILSIDEIIPVGRSNSFVIEDAIMIEEPFADFEVFIVYEIDENETNDAIDGFIVANEFTENDLRISATTGNIECFSDSTNLIINLSNQSCETIEAPQIIEIAVLKSLTFDTIYKENYILGNNLLAGSEINISRNILHGFQSSSDAIVRATYDSDPNPLNNSTDIEILVLQTIPADYINDFNSDRDLNSNHLYFADEGFFSQFGTTKHEGDGHFYSTGSFEDAIGRLCINPDENFDSEVGGFFSPIVTELIACVDYAGVTNPKIDFDMIQYRNDNLDILSDYSSSIEVSWDGSDQGKKVIGGQQEGQVVNHIIDFAPNFKGTVKIKFLNFTGVGVFGFGFLDYDVTLIDYINFGSTVSTENLNVLTDEVKIFPDPVSDILNIKSTADISEISIFDMTGKSIMMRKFSETIDVMSLLAGPYNLVFTTKDQQVGVRRFIKM